MTLTPNFLPVGSIVEYNISEHETPEWTPTTLDAVDLQWLDGDSDEFNRCHRGIQLTPEILVEWCGFEKEKNESVDCFINGNILIRVFKDRFNVIAPNSNVNLTEIPPLHIFQMLYSALTQTVLPITIK